MNNLELLINLDMEKEFLGTLIVYPELIDETFIKPDHFYHTVNKNVMHLVYAVKKKGAIPTLNTIIDVASSARKIDDIGGMKYITELATTQFTKETFNQLQKTLIEKSQKRDAYNVLQQKMNMLLETEFGEFAESLTTDINNIADSGGVDTDDGNIKQAIQNVFDEMQKERNGIRGASTGFKMLDDYTNGFQKGKLIVLGARPSVGKTAMVTNITETHSIKNDEVTAVFSLEMTTEELIERMISSIGNIDSGLMRNPLKSFNDNHWDKTVSTIGLIGNSNTYIFDKPLVDVAYIRSKCRAIQRKHPEKHLMVFIDYLQLIQGDPKLDFNKNLQMGEISKALKRMAKEMQITIVALSQLGRSVEQRQDKRPIMSDIRDSGQIEQDCDIIGMLYRDELYNPDTDQKDIMEVIVVKNRGGRIGTIKLAFKKDYSKIIDLQKY